MANKITTIIDFVTDSAQRSVKGFRQSVADADGSVNKFKAGTSSAFSTVQANAGALALGAGTALAVFGAKAVTAFTDGALAAGKFSDATGLAVDDASRWAEIANDVGVSTETMSGGFVKLEKAIASGSPAVEDLGLKVQKTADGQTDMNATMLVAIDRLGKIKDPAEKAKLASELFGRGFADMAEIVLGDADKIRESLEGVADAQVFDADEVEKARRYREAMDSLQDSMAEISMIVGEALVPAISDFAEGLADVRSGIDALPGVPKAVQLWWDYASPQGWVRNVGRVESEIVGLGKSLLGMGKDAEQSSNLTAGAMGQIAGASAELRANLDRQSESMEVGTRQSEAYVDLLEGRWASAQREVAAATERSQRAHKLLADAINDTRQAAFDSLETMFDYEQSVAATVEAAANYNTVLTETPEELAAVREAEIAAAEAALRQAEDMAAAAGATEDSTTKALLMRDELGRLQAKFPELSAVLQAYIDTLNAVPGVVTTQLILNSAGQASTAQITGASGRVIDAVGTGQFPAGRVINNNFYVQNLDPAKVVDATRRYDRFNPS